MNILPVSTELVIVVVSVNTGVVICDELSVKTEIVPIEDVDKVIVDASVSLIIVANIKIKSTIKIFSKKQKFFV